MTRRRSPCAVLAIFVLMLSPFASASGGEEDYVTRIGFSYRYEEIEHLAEKGVIMLEQLFSDDEMRFGAYDPDWTGHYAYFLLPEAFEGADYAQGDAFRFTIDMRGESIQMDGTEIRRLVSIEAIGKCFYGMLVQAGGDSIVMACYPPSPDKEIAQYRWAITEETIHFMEPLELGKTYDVLVNQDTEEVIATCRKNG